MLYTKNSPRNSWSPHFMIALWNQKSQNAWTSCTLDSGINIGVSSLIFGLFSRGYVLIREGNAYFFQNIPYLMVLVMLILRATLNIFVIRLFQSLEYLQVLTDMPAKWPSQLNGITFLHLMSKIVIARLKILPSLFSEL
jgi:hypothetical protein